jgi:hypothetical protein
LRRLDATFDGAARRAARIGPLDQLAFPTAFHPTAKKSWLVIEQVEHVDPFPRACNILATTPIDLVSHDRCLRNSSRLFLLP